VYIGKVAYAYAGEMSEPTNIAIKDGIVSISSGAFYNKNKLVNITIPKSVSNIGREAFHKCGNLKKVTISNPDGQGNHSDEIYSNKSIDDYAFYECTELLDIEIPEGIKNIGDFAFCDCQSLQSITIPNIFSFVLHLN